MISYVSSHYDFPLYAIYIAVTPHHHHTVAHGATLIRGVPTVICTAMVVRCGDIMNMIHHVMMIHLQHSQVHLYLIQTCTCPLTSQDIRYVDTVLVSIIVTLNFILEQAKVGKDV
jgi:hypothetical protein